MADLTGVVDDSRYWTMRSILSRCGLTFSQVESMDRLASLAKRSECKEDGEQRVQRVLFEYRLAKGANSEGWKTDIPLEVRARVVFYRSFDGIGKIKRHLREHNILNSDALKRVDDEWVGKGEYTAGCKYYMRSGGIPVFIELSDDFML